MSGGCAITGVMRDLVHPTSRSRRSRSADRENRSSGGATGWPCPAAPPAQGAGRCQCPSGPGCPGFSCASGTPTRAVFTVCRALSLSRVALSGFCFSCSPGRRQAGVSLSASMGGEAQGVAAQVSGRQGRAPTGPQAALRPRHVGLCFQERGPRPRGMIRSHATRGIPEHSQVFQGEQEPQLDAKLPRLHEAAGKAHQAEPTRPPTLKTKRREQKPAWAFPWGTLPPIKICEACTVIISL